MNGNYLATTDKLSNAMPVTVAAVEGQEGKYTLSYKEGEATKYIEVYEYQTGKYGVRLADTATNYFEYDETLKTFLAVFGEDKFYLGTYNKNQNFSASNTSYISGDNASKIGVSQFLGIVGEMQFVAEKTEDPAEDPTENPTEEPKTYAVADFVEMGVAYKAGFFQKSLNKQLWFNGEFNDGRGQTSETVAGAVDVYVEAATNGGYYLYVLGENNTKKYIETYPNGDTARIKFVETPSMVWEALNAAKTFYQNVNGADRYMGTYSSYNTVSLSETSRITGDKASDIGVSQFVLTFTKSTEAADPEPEETPAVTEELAQAVTISFASLTGKGAEFDVAKLQTALASDQLGITVKSVTKVYDGNGSGGAFPNTPGFIKTGTGSVKGEMTIVLDKLVSKITISCHDFYKKDADHLTNSNKISVNGCDAVLAPYNEEATPADLVFEFATPTNEITISVDKRVFIFGITFE